MIQKIISFFDKIQFIHELYHFNELYIRHNFERFVTVTPFFLTETNSDWSFYVPKDYQRDILYCLYCPNLFSLPESQRIFTPLTVFSTKARHDKHMFSRFASIY